MNYFSPIISKITVTAMMLSVFCFAPLIFAEANAPDANLDGQLKINRWALLNSADEQIRIDTAAEMLKSPAADTRRVLLDTLNSSDNAVAQASVCKAIGQFRSYPQLMPGSQDFIVPLMNIIKGQNVQLAELAGRASLIFSYKQVRNYLEDAAENSALSASARKNAIFAISIRPDKEALSELIELVDNKNAEIASAAADALQDWLPAVKDKKLWRKTLKDLENKSRQDILRDRLLVQEQKVQQLSDEIAKWQKRYIACLDIVYQTVTEDNARAKLIAENLAFDQSQVKLWAIEKISMWRKSGKQLPLETIGKPLIGLVSDSDSQVRLATANLLGVLTNTASADALFAQLKAETASDVKTEILIALAHICNFALSPGAEVKINPEIRVQTLKIASEFLRDSNPIAAAEIFRNLLLQDGLEEAKVKSYFEIIAACYKKAANEQTKIRLLEEMTRLCGNDSYYKAAAGDIFEDIFLAAVDDKNNKIAAPAAEGLIRTDQAGAFELLKQKGFTKHPSDKIRSELIATAGQIGTQDDLEWLGAIVTNSESENERKAAGEAMMNIFKNCKADVLLAWAQKFSRQLKTKNDEFLLSKTKSLFETAEKKAQSDGDTKLLFTVRYSTAGFYSDAASYDQAAKYYGILLQSNPEPNQASDITAKLLDMHLRSGQIGSAKEIVTNFLLTEDLSPSSEIARVLDSYFTANQNSRQAQRALLAMSSIKILEQNSRPLWSRHLEDWKSLIKVSENASEESNNSPEAVTSAESNNPEEPNGISAL